MKLSELPIRIIRPDIRYPTDITHIVSVSDIRIKYPNTRKIAGYPKIISESLSDPSRSVGKYPYHLHPYSLCSLFGAKYKCSVLEYPSELKHSSVFRISMWNVGTSLLI